MRNYRKILATIAYKEKGSIRAFIANEAMREDDKYIEYFFKDLSRYGCISGMVSSLIRYTDTHKFFDEYYDEIQEILEDWNDSGLEFKFDGHDLKNQLAWLAFEEIARKMANEDLRLEI